MVANHAETIRRALTGDDSFMSFMPEELLAALDALVARIEELEAERDAMYETVKYTYWRDTAKRYREALEAIADPSQTHWSAVGRVAVQSARAALAGTDA